MEEDQVRGFDPVSDNLSQFVTVRERADFLCSDMMWILNSLIGSKQKLLKVVRELLTLPENTESLELSTTFAS
jgi:hypothetical protein